MIKPSLHRSDSFAQRTVEPLALAELNRELKLNLRPAVVKLPNDTRVQIDGFDEAAKIACEIYARVGKLKGSQPDKLASDILKLILVERHLCGKWQKIICFVDEDASKSLKNLSWLASTCDIFKIEVRVVQITELTRQSLLEAQSRQKMINVAD